MYGKADELFPFNMVSMNHLLSESICISELIRGLKHSFAQILYITIVLYKQDLYTSLGRVSFRYLK